MKKITLKNFTLLFDNILKTIYSLEIKSFEISLELNKITNKYIFIISENIGSKSFTHIVHKDFTENQAINNINAFIKWKIFDGNEANEDDYPIPYKTITSNDFDYIKNQLSSSYYEFRYKE